MAPGRPALTPVAFTGPGPILVQAEYLEGQVDPRLVREHFPALPVLVSDPLVLELERDRYAVLFRFGGVVFWNCPETLTSQFLEDLQGLKGVGAWLPAARDELLVQVGAAHDDVSFAGLAIQELSREHLSLVSLALAQSVALDHFEQAVSSVLARFQPIVATLREAGRLDLPRREVLRLVGFSLEVRGAVLENLTLFDDPPETWESEALAHLDSDLYDHFDLEERLKAIHHKLAYLQDTGATCLELLTTRKNHRLEWIIILLIAFEIGMTLFKEAMAHWR